MKILLKDPAKVDAVIKKITDKYPLEGDIFMKYNVPCIKADLDNGDMIILEVQYTHSANGNCVGCYMYYSRLKGIPTDTEFLNDKEW